ncbi:UNVERIFIED_CONTAM: hypothetical protein K2H54_023319 [Gekko kuhli]
MASSGAPGTRMTSTVSINISTPSFYSPQKKYAPVVAPKPKVNPFKAGGAGPGNGLEQTPSPPPPPQLAGACAQIGKVGEIPAAVAVAPSLTEESTFHMSQIKSCVTFLSSGSSKFKLCSLQLDGGALLERTGFPVALVNVSDVPRLERAKQALGRPARLLIRSLIPDPSIFLKK